MGKQTQKKTGLKKFLSRIIKRKPSGQNGDDQSENSVLDGGTRENVMDNSTQQPNEGSFEDSIESVQQPEKCYATETHISCIDRGANEDNYWSNMPAENLPRNRKPLIMLGKPEKSNPEQPSNVQNGQPSSSGYKPSSPNTEKALQLLQKLEAKRKGDPAPAKILQRSRRSRSNKAVITLLQNDANTQMFKGNRNTQGGLEESSYESMNEVQSLERTTKVSDDMDIGKPLASSTLTKSNPLQKATKSSSHNTEKQSVVKKKKRRSDKQSDSQSFHDSPNIQKQINEGCVNENIKVEKESNKENVLVEMDTSLVTDSSVKSKTSSDIQVKQKSSEDKHQRKRSAKIKDKTSMQPLIKRLDDKIPMTIKSAISNINNNSTEVNLVGLGTPDTINNSRNSTGSNTNITEDIRPIIHYHVTIQNCDGININVNKSDSNFKPQNIEVSHDGKLQKLSWIEDHSVSQIPSQGEIINSLTNSNESWSGTSTSTIIAGHEQFPENQSIISCETNTTVLVSNDVNFDDAVSDMTCDTTYLVDADAWGCDGLLDEDLEHLSVCEHKLDNSTSATSLHTSLRNRLNKSNPESFHLNRNHSFSKSVPSRIPKHTRTSSSPSLSRSKEKDFIPPWRSESANSVSRKSKPSEKEKSRSSKHTFERSQSSSSLCARNTSTDNSQNIRSKATNKNSSKPKQSAVSRLFHNLLNPNKQNSHENITDKSLSRQVVTVDNKHPKNTSISDTGLRQEGKQNTNLTTKIPIPVQHHQNGKNNKEKGIMSKTSAFIPVIHTTSAQILAHNNSAQNDVSSTLIHLTTEDNNKEAKNSDEKIKLNLVLVDTNTEVTEVNNTKKTESQTNNLPKSRPITPFDKKEDDQKAKPIAKVIPVARVSPQTVSSSSSSIHTVASNNYVSTSYGANNNTTSSSLFMSSTTLAQQTVTSVTPTTTLPYSSTNFNLSSPGSSISHLSNHSTQQNVPSTSYTPGYAFSTTSYTQRYTPIFVSTNQTLTTTRSANTQSLFSSSNNTQSNNTRASTSVTPLPRSSNRSTPIVRHNDVTLNFDSSSDSSTDSGDDATTAAVFDDSTLSLLQASPHVLMVDEDLDVTSSRQNFRRFGLGSTIQPTLRRQRRGNHNRSHSASRNRGQTLEERVASLRGQIVRVPGVLILSTRRNRMVVYLSQERPNLEGVFKFMQENGVSRTDYEVEILPWGNRSSVLRNGSIGASGSSTLSSVRSQAASS